MRVLVADKLPDQATERLVAGGFDVRVDAGLHGDALRAALEAEDPDILVVRGTRVEAGHVDAARRLALVVRAGAGVNTIALDACSARGIHVANCPGKNAVAVAELTMGLLLALDRRIPDNVAALREGRWEKGRFGKARGLHGRTLGVLGLGEIGMAVVARARAFGMPVVAWSRSLTDARARALDVERAATPEDLARRADAVSVHLALTPDTRGLVGRTFFDAMRPGAFFLNTSRAEVVDQAALLRAVDEKGLRAGLDVYAGEPPGKDGTFDDPIGAHPAVYGTHHIGASTDQAQEAVAAEACRVVEVFRDTGKAPNCVNLAKRSRADHTLVVRHRDRVGVLAAILDQLRRAEINVEEMENIVFDGGEAATARIQIVGAPAADVLGAMGAHEHVFSVSVVPLA